MSDVLVFTPKHKLDFQKNYAEFIAFAKNDLTLFDDHEFEAPLGIQNGWECDKWSWKTAREKKLTIVFGNSVNPVSYTHLTLPTTPYV